ncbi:uncharacterized protein LOC135153427 [Lytechinus pictus]|uniref:uncharacterized protein LOC135153427 n=1 Tax=Lytechinus pictus TaxID=7653 RepID=UPI0030BA1940
MEEEEVRETRSTPKTNVTTVATGMQTDVSTMYLDETEDTGMQTDVTWTTIDETGTQTDMTMTDITKRDADGHDNGRVTEKMLQDHLPSGKHAEMEEEEVRETRSVPKTNVGVECDFGMFDRLIHMKLAAGMMAIESIIICVRTVAITGTQTDVSMMYVDETEDTGMQTDVTWTAIDETGTQTDMTMEDSTTSTCSGTTTTTASAVTGSTNNLVTEKMLQDHLPSGKHAEMEEEEVRETRSVPNTNVGVERDFGMLDRLIHMKLAAGMMAIESIIICVTTVATGMQTDVSTMYLDETEDTGMQTDVTWTTIDETGTQTDMTMTDITKRDADGHDNGRVTEKMLQDHLPSGKHAEMEEEEVRETRSVPKTNVGVECDFGMFDRLIHMKLAAGMMAIESIIICVRTVAITGTQTDVSMMYVDETEDTGMQTDVTWTAIDETGTQTDMTMEDSTTSTCSGTTTTTASAVTGSTNNLVTEKMLQDHLPSGKHAEMEEEEVRETRSVPNTNVGVERDFGMLDRLIHMKLAAGMMAIESIIICVTTVATGTQTDVSTMYVDETEDTGIQTDMTWTDIDETGTQTDMTMTDIDERGTQTDMTMEDSTTSTCNGTTRTTASAVTGSTNNLVQKKHTECMLLHCQSELLKLRGKFRAAQKERQRRI